LETHERRAQRRTIQRHGCNANTLKS
jgi:hypothetical protein